MSQYGTAKEYARGYDDGAAETAERYEDLISACAHLLDLWAENKNLTVPAQNIAAALDKLR